MKGNEDFEYEYQEVIGLAVHGLRDYLETTLTGVDEWGDVEAERPKNFKDGESDIRVYTNLYHLEEMSLDVEEFHPSLKGIFERIEEGVSDAMWEEFPSKLNKLGLKKGCQLYGSDLKSDPELEETLYSWIDEIKFDFGILLSFTFSYEILNSEAEKFKLHLMVCPARYQTGMNIYKERPHWFDSLYEASFTVEPQDLEKNSKSLEKILKKQIDLAVKELNL